jgi:hypothetical protein
VNDLNKSIRDRYQLDQVILSDENYQLHLNARVIDSARLSSREIAGFIVDRLNKTEGIFRVFSIDELNTTPLPARIREMLNNGYYPPRSGDIQILLMPNYIDAYSNTGTTHGLWNPYDSHIPLIWYGKGIKQGTLNREVGMTDIAPTLAALLRIQLPNGATGRVIEEVIK